MPPKAKRMCNQCYVLRYIKSVAFNIIESADLTVVSLVKTALLVRILVCV